MKTVFSKTLLSIVGVAFIILMFTNPNDISLRSKFTYFSNGQYAQLNIRAGKVDISNYIIFSRAKVTVESKQSAPGLLPDKYNSYIRECTGILGNWNCK